MRAVGAIVVSAVLLVAGCSDDNPTDAMADELGELELPDEFRFEAERRHAADECQEPCPSATHYYISDLDPAAACAALADPIAEWAETSEPLPGDPDAAIFRCGFDGTTESGLLRVSVFADVDIESGIGHIGNDRIDAPHNSVVRVTINR
jgi:hypothetical protein